MTVKKTSANDFQISCLVNTVTTLWQRARMEKVEMSGTSSIHHSVNSISAVMS